MSTPVEGGRGLRVKVLGFPVQMDLSFVLIMGLLGYLSGAQNIRDMLLWLAVATGSVLVHELGHAVIARTTGAHPQVALTGFGGVTVFEPPRQLSRWRSLSISLAGPLVGIAVGLVLLVVWRVYAYSFAPHSWQQVTLEFALFTTFGWSGLNLLPVLPLDGGQAMRELLPGEPAVRARRANIVSVVVLVPLVVLSLIWGLVGLGVFLLLFGFVNVQALIRPARTADAGPQSGAAELTPEQAVVGLLWQGAPSAARQTLESLPPGTPVDLAVHGAVLATTDQPAQGFALLHQELARRPDDPNVVVLLFLAHLLRHDWDAVEAQLRADNAALIPLSVVERAVQEATAAGRPDVVARISALPRPGAR